MAFLSFWHGHLSCEKNPYSKEHGENRHICRLQFSLQEQTKDKLDGLCILYMLHSKTESTVILQLPGERNNKSDFFPKIWQIFKVYLYSSTARDHCASLHRFQPKTKVVKCMQSMRAILQAVSKNLCAFSHVFFTRTFHACSSRIITLLCGKFPHKKCV